MNSELREMLEKIEYDVVVKGHYSLVKMLNERTYHEALSEIKGAYKITERKYGVLIEEL
jgi:flagellar biosynthesis regulator FlbT